MVMRGITPDAGDVLIVEEHRLRIPGLRERVATACSFVVDAARRAGLDDRSVHHCQLAVDEACTNVIEHGYGEAMLLNDQQTIEIICRLEGNRFSITVTDQGPAFDPLGRTDPDPTASFETREPGGWGIFFIKKVMDEVYYQYEQGRNSLIMVKYLRDYPRMVSPGDLSTLISVVAVAPQVWVIQPHGRLDAHLCPSVEATVERQLHAGCKYLVLDLSDVSYVSSMGLKLLVSLWQRAREAKGDIVLAALQPRVREVLQIIGLDLVFTLYDTSELATARFTT